MNASEAAYEVSQDLVALDKLEAMKRGERVILSHDQMDRLDKLAQDCEITTCMNANCIGTLPVLIGWIGKKNAPKNIHHAITRDGGMLAWGTVDDSLTVPQLAARLGR